MNDPFDNKIRDRGLIKWQGFFMPEHKAMINEMHEEQNKVDKPYVDGWTLNEFESKLIWAHNEQLEVLIKRWRSGVIEEFKGIVLRFDQSIQQIFIETSEGLERIGFYEIVNVDVPD
ncbi:YolD-like family protein [Jeotgalibacillus soli]|uniref:YolD-like protein n=1 Tax=Jeotgalibacillus soli TaxID=889306 RepID=A0A0C2VMV2_9BACL|nr:YolD-like family protein [Jeotgalibacillus soli]KIL45776.1 hypothetical protein KP78_21250 [Jeotgalibacillus soli]